MFLVSKHKTLPADDRTQRAIAEGVHRESAGAPT